MIRFALHGGAGELDAGSDTREQRAAMRAIATQALAELRAGAHALDVVEAAVAALEDCPLFNAGTGAVLNAEGIPELDAAIMDGSQLRFGAVTAVSRLRNPVHIARRMLETGPHVLMAGPGAEAYAHSQGFELVDPQTLITAQRLTQLKQAQRAGTILLDHDTADEMLSAANPAKGAEMAAGIAPEIGSETAPVIGSAISPGIRSGINPTAISDQGPDAGFGTVGAVARDQRGALAAATSTGGLTNKLPGRIGDSPIPGAGTLADHRGVAISCTGTGEAFIRAGFSALVNAQRRFTDLSLAQSCANALDQLRAVNGRGGCIVIDRDGTLLTPFNAGAMFRAWVGADGQLHVAVGNDDTDQDLLA